MITNEQVEALRGKFKKEPSTQTPTNNGKFNLEKYLSHYGVEITGTKQVGTSTLYILKECLFDPSHAPGEASIGITAEGKLFYQCFHNSCQGKEWKNARQIISGNDLLTPFMEGYKKKEGESESTEEKTIKDYPPFTTPSEILNDYELDEVKPDLVEGIIKEGSLLFISGLPGHMKTFLAIAFCIGASSSGIFLSRRVKKCKAFYFDKENPKPVWRKRLRQLMKESNTENFRIWSYWQTPEPPIIKKPEGDIYIKLAKENPGSLFVFDSLIKFYPKGTNENSATDISPVMAMFREMTKYDVTVLVLHHRGKDGSMDYRGTTEILASVDLAYSVDKHENRLTLKCLKDRYNQEKNIDLEVREDIEGGLFFEDVSEKEMEKAYQEKIKTYQALQNMISEMIQEGVETNQSKIIEYAKNKLSIGKKKLPELLESGINHYWTIAKDTKGHRKVFFPTPRNNTPGYHSQHTDNTEKKYYTHPSPIYRDGNNGVDTPGEEVLSHIQGEDTHNNNDITTYNNKEKVLYPHGKNTIGDNGVDTQGNFIHEEDDMPEVVGERWQF